jgi:hypothetical protein
MTPDPKPAAGETKPAQDAICASCGKTFGDYIHNLPEGRDDWDNHEFVSVAPSPASSPRKDELVSVNEPRFTCPICGSDVAESYRYKHVCVAEKTAESQLRELTAESARQKFIKEDIRDQRDKAWEENAELRSTIEKLENRLESNLGTLRHTVVRMEFLGHGHGELDLQIERAERQLAELRSK